MPEVSLVATFAGTVAGFVLGALWYGPVFGRVWMKAVGLTREELGRDFSPARTYGITFVLGLIASFVFGLFLGPHPGVTFGLATGSAAGICWVATSLATNYLFEGRGGTLILINGGYHAVRFALIGLAFGLLG